MYNGIVVTSCKKGLNEIAGSLHPFLPLFGHCTLENTRGS